MHVYLVDVRLKVDGPNEPYQIFTFIFDSHPEENELLHAFENEPYIKALPTFTRLMALLSECLNIWGIPRFPAEPTILGIMKMQSVGCHWHANYTVELPKHPASSFMGAELGGISIRRKEVIGLAGE